MRPDYVTMRGISGSLRSIAESLHCIATALQQQPMQHEALLSELQQVPAAVNDLGDILEEFPRRLHPRRPPKQ